MYTYIRYEKVDLGFMTLVSQMKKIIMAKIVKHRSMIMILLSSCDLPLQVHYHHDHAHNKWLLLAVTALKKSQQSLGTHGHMISCVCMTKTCLVTLIIFFLQNRAILDSIVVSIPACHAGDRGSIPRRGGILLICWPISFEKKRKRMWFM